MRNEKPTLILSFDGNTTLLIFNTLCGCLLTQLKIEFHMFESTQIQGEFLSKYEAIAYYLLT